MDDIFYELFQSISNSVKNSDYELALLYIIELRKLDKEYIYKEIKNMVINLIDDDCIKKSEINTELDLASKESIDLLKDPKQYEMTVKLTSLKSNPHLLKSFVDMIFDEYNAKNDDNKASFIRGQILRKCIFKLAMSYYENNRFISISPQNKSEINFEIIEKAYEHLKENMFVNKELYELNARYNVLKNEIESLIKVIELFQEHFMSDSNNLFYLGYKLMELLFIDENLFYKNKFISNLSNEQINKLIDLNILVKTNNEYVLNYDNVDLNRKKISNIDGLDICCQINNSIQKVHKYSKTNESDESLIIFIHSILSQYLGKSILPLRDFTLSNSISDKEWKISENENFKKICDLLEDVYTSKLQEYTVLENQMRCNSISNNTIKTSVDFEEFSKMIYLLHLINSIDKNHDIIFNLDESFEKIVFSKVIDSELIKDLYDSKKQSNIIEEIDYGFSLAKKVNFSVDKSKSSNLLSYLMFSPDKNGKNSIVYDSNYKTLINSWYILIFYELAKFYSEESLKQEIKKYIKQLKNKEEKLDLYYNHMGVTALDYKIYCSTRRKQIEDEIQNIKSLLVKPAGFISYILSKYTSMVYREYGGTKEIETAIRKIKDSINDIYVETFKDLKYNSDVCVTSENGIEECDIDVVKKILDTIVSNDAHIMAEKVEITFKIVKKNIIYNIAKKNCRRFFITLLKSKIYDNYTFEKMNLIEKIKSTPFPKGIKIEIYKLLDNQTLDYERILDILCNIENEIDNNFITKVINKRYCDIISNLISLTKRCINYSMFNNTLLKLLNDCHQFNIGAEFDSELNKIYFNNDLELNGILNKLLEDIDSYLQNDIDTNVNVIIRYAKDRLEEQYSDFEKNLLSFIDINKKSKFEYEATGDELVKFKSVCDTIGAKITDAIKLLSNKENFLVILSLAASYDDTIQQIQSSGHEFEAMNSIHPIAAKGLEQNFSDEVKRNLLSFNSKEKEGPHLLQDFDFENTEYQKKKKL